MNMDEYIIVYAIIDKLPPSWKDYKRSLKHKKKGCYFRRVRPTPPYREGNQNSNKKHKGVCHHCGKLGHFKRDFRLLKKKNKENTSKFVTMILYEIYSLLYLKNIDFGTPVETMAMPKRTIIEDPPKIQRSKRPTHWQAVYRILKYLKFTKNYSIQNFGYPSVLEGFTNASSITKKDDHTSTKTKQNKK
ncbi:hypothetical protein ACOSQ3_027295 [Xanthoceras sorbifolium]